MTAPYTLDEAAAELSVTPRHLRDLIDESQIAAFDVRSPGAVAPCVAHREAGDRGVQGAQEGGAMPARGEGARGVKGLWWNEAEDCWHYDFRVSGHRFRGSCRTKARREAERHVQELRRQAAASLRESAGIEPMSFETASSRWWLEKRQHRARPHEIERDLAWLQTAIGARTLDPLNRRQ